jgi:hypothetical protein
MTDLNPTDVEQQEYILTLRNGVELGLGRHSGLFFLDFSRNLV